MAVVLVASAAAKVAARGGAATALASFGIHRPALQRSLWWALVGAELVVAGTIVAGFPLAAVALFGAFTLAVAVALARGRRGAPCGCFGSRSRLGLLALVRAAVLTLASGSIPLLDDVRPGSTAWLTAGLVVALVAVGGLGVAVFALAREVGELRLAVAPQGALSIAEEGPPVGAHLPLAERFEPGAKLALAVFSSARCRLCRALEPAVRLVGDEPGVELAVFDEERDGDVWQELAIPGSPYAVVMANDGAVLAKGTFNTLAQLDSLVRAGERELAVA